VLFRHRNEFGLDVNADKTKYVVMSRDQNAGWSHSIKTDNNSFERVEEFKYLGTKLTHQNSIQEEIKSIKLREYHPDVFIDNSRN